jgi:hypothetical protein
VLQVSLNFERDLQGLRAGGSPASASVRGGLETSSVVGFVLSLSSASAFHVLRPTLRVDSPKQSPCCPQTLGVYGSSQRGGVERTQEEPGTQARPGGGGVTLGKS